MELKNIVYNNLITILQNLTTNGPSFDDFYNGLGSEDRKSDLFKLAEDIDTELKKIQKSKLDGKIHQEFSDLISFLNKLLIDFPEYPLNRVFEVLVIIYLINSLSESIDEDVSIEIEQPVENFELVKLTKKIYQRNFAFHDSGDITNSLVLLDFSDPKKIAEYFAENSLPKELIIQLLIFIGRPGVAIDNEQYALCNSLIAANYNQIWSALCVHIVKDGKLIHQPHDYQNAPTVNPLLIINQQNGFQQFDESLLILSEYNHQKDILDKYLRIYHLVENFMYKYPLTQLERKYAGNIFSIRDFQRMNDVMKNNEISSIKNLVKAVCLKEFTPGKIFSSYILEKWKGLFPLIIADKTKIDMLLSLLRLENTYDSIDLDKTPHFFASLIYAFRNSLVHNRETEFHLTHQTLLNHNTTVNTAQLILENFITPLLEEIIFYLIITQNDLVWFTNPTLQLYNNN